MPGRTEALAPLRLPPGAFASEGVLPGILGRQHGLAACCLLDDGGNLGQDEFS